MTDKEFIHALKMGRRVGAMPNEVILSRSTFNDLSPKLINDLVGNYTPHPDEYPNGPLFITRAFISFIIKDDVPDNALYFLEHYPDLNKNESLKDDTD